MKVIAAIGVAAAGLAAAFALAMPTSALAWNWRQLPAGYHATSVIYTALDGSTCRQVSIDGNYMGDDCVDPTGLQANVDAYVNATICTVNPAAGQANGMCLPTTTTTPATTAATTTDPVATTTTTDPATTPTTTATVTDTVVTTGAAAPQPAVTTTDTTASCDLECLLARVEALEKKYEALAARVTAIEEANAAAWQVYSDEIASGVDPAQAALDARSAALNAIYQLG